MLWEIIAVIHTFGGSIMLSAITERTPPTQFLLIFGVVLFFSNLILIVFSYDFKKHDFRKFKLKSREFNYLQLTFWISMLNMFIFVMILMTPS